MMIECQSRCQWSVDQGLIEGSERHSKADSFSAHDPVCITILIIYKFSLISTLVRMYGTFPVFLLQRSTVFLFSALVEIRIMQ